MVGTRALVIGISLAMVLMSPAAARAQTAESNPADPPRFQADVVVTPERGETARNLVSASTVVIEGASLVALPAVQFGEIGTFLPGFHMQQAQPYSVTPLISARGFFGGGEAEYVLLLVDGVPTMDAESGLIDWAAIPTSSIRRIEAFRGPGASLYGDSAVGGVIQVLTDRRTNGGALNVSGGSFGTFLADGSYGRRSSSAGVVITAAGLRTSGASDHTAAKRVVLDAAVDGRIRDAVWRLTANGNNRDRDDAGPLSAEASSRDPFASDSLFRFDTLSRHGFGTAFTVDAGAGRWRHRARVHATVRDDDLVRTILLAPGLGDRSARTLSTTVFGGSAESERAVSILKSAINVRFGLDVSGEHLDTTYRPVGDTGERRSQTSATSGGRVRTGAFTSSSWEPASRLRLTAGLRWDRIAEDFDLPLGGAPSHDAWSPRVGTTVRLNDDGSAALFVQASKAFKVPTLDQLFDPRPFPDFRGGSFTISNPRLNPQRATNVEAGVSGGSSVRWSVLGYRMMVDNEIDFDVRTFSYANIGRSRHTGLEIEAGTRSFGHIQPSVTYALVRVNRPEEDRQLKNVPRHIFTASAAVDLIGGVAAVLRYRRTAGAFLDDENAYTVEGPSTFDLRVRRAVGRHTVFLDMLNLADDRYQEYGFTLTDFQGQSVPYSYPGAPRAVRAGVIASF